MNVIAVGPRGWVERRLTLEPTFRGSAYGYFQTWWKEVRFFHRDGHVYTAADVRPPRKLGFIDRVLATTVYNPSMEFIIEYERSAPYVIPDLQVAIERAIEDDDDVFTQFHERDELVAHLRRAQSFDEVIAVLQLAETPSDDGNELLGTN
jgi:hypothetical protein